MYRYVRLAPNSVTLCSVARKLACFPYLVNTRATYNSTDYCCYYRVAVKRCPLPSLLLGGRTCRAFVGKNLQRWQEHNAQNDHVRQTENHCYANNQIFATTAAPLVRNGSGGSGTRPLSVVKSFDLSDESVATLVRELEIEERIVDAARRMADMPARNRKEKQQRRQSLQQ